MATLKRGSDGSAFSRCDSCNKNVPVATADMHDCKQDQKTKEFLDKVPIEVQVSGRPLKEKNAVAIMEKTKRKADFQKAKKSRKSAKPKDHDQPKRPPTAFFLFLEEFRKTFKENNPDSKGVGEVSKSAGEKWKAMSDEEKGPFLERAAGLKVNYEVALKAFKASKKLNPDVDSEEKCDENEDPADESKE